MHSMHIIRGMRKTIYIRNADKPLFDKLAKFAYKSRQSESEIISNALRNYLDKVK